MPNRTYIVETRTGDYDSAGTNAGVRIQLMRAKGRTGEMRLDNPSHNDFVRGAVNHFTVSGEDIGWADQIRVFHDNKGNKPGWYLDYVKVTYPDLSLALHADFYRWLAVKMGDGLIDVTKNVNVGEVELVANPYLEKIYLGYNVDRRRNDSSSSDYYEHNFIWEFTQGVSLTLSRSRTVQRNAGMSASFFGIGSSFESEVIRSTATQLSTSAQEKLTHEMKVSTEIAPGQSKTYVVFYYQQLLTSDAVANGISVPYDNRFALTWDIAAFDGWLSESDVNQRVKEILAQTIGVSVPVHAPLQKMDIRFGRKQLSGATTAASIGRAVRGEPSQFLKQSHIARHPGAVLLAASTQIFRP